MSKKMSKTLAGELAERTLGVVNPANRAIALRAALQRHGFAAQEPDTVAMGDRKALASWLMAAYAGSPKA